MKRITLFRHAKSSWDDPSLADFDRPLNPRGRRSAPEMGRRLKLSGQVPDLIISSPAVRAITTARMASEEMGYPEGNIIEEPLLYHAGATRIFQVVNSLESHARHLMLIGHNPGFNDFANCLSESRIDNLPTAALFAVDFEVEDWSEVRPGEGRFVYFDYPKNPASP